MKTKKKQCKHIWQIIQRQGGYWYQPPVSSQSGAGGGGGTPMAIQNDAMAVCTKCLEKRYL